MNEHSSGGNDVIGKRQLGKVAQGPCQHHATKAATNLDTACTLISRISVRLALRKIKLVLSRAYVDVGVCLLAIIDLWSRDLNVRGTCGDRHVGDHELRHSFVSEAVCRIHGNSVAMRIDELFINPIS